MTGPGPLLASGRDSDIFAYGDDEKLVLRRARAGRSMASEARVMEYVRGHGYPVPAIDHLSDDGTDMVMERIAGLSMVEALGQKPWTIGANGALLGDLHRQLHTIAAPDWLGPGPGPEGTCLIHLDLHPLNVILGPSGPVVIDWPNARRGVAEFDVAVSWLLMTAGEIPGHRIKAAVMGLARGRLMKGFLRDFDPGPLRSLMRAAVEWKVADPHMSETERGRMWDLVRRVEAAATA